MDILRKKILKDIDDLKQSIRQQRKNMRSTIMKNKDDLYMFDWERDDESIPDNAYDEFANTKTLLTLIIWTTLIIMVFLMLFQGMKLILSKDPVVNTSSPAPIESVQSDQLNKL